jgi:hypothetical protein
MASWDNGSSIIIDPICNDVMAVLVCREKKGPGRVSGKSARFFTVGWRAKGQWWFLLYACGFARNWLG